MHVGHRLDYPRSTLPNGEGPPDCSPEMADQVDRGVKQLLASAYEEAKDILLAHRAELDTVAAALVKRESLDNAEFLRLLSLREATETPSRRSSSRNRPRHRPAVSATPRSPTFGEAVPPEMVDLATLAQ
jgi:hypothetical protein